MLGLNTSNGLCGIVKNSDDGYVPGDEGMMDYKSSLVLNATYDHHWEYAGYVGKNEGTVNRVKMTGEYEADPEPVSEGGESDGQAPEEEPSEPAPETVSENVPETVSENAPETVSENAPETVSVNETEPVEEPSEPAPETVSVNEAAIPSKDETTSDERSGD